MRWLAETRRWLAALTFIGILNIPSGLAAPGQSTAGAALPEYDARFFQNLQSIFDTFRSANLQRVFQSSPPIGCSELLGDWRTAAFFNEDPRLERWYYRTFQEVQADLSRYIFEGRCDSESADVEVISRFPVRESMEAYNRREIAFDRIAFRVNEPVRATFDSRSRIYTFELPYLFVTGRSGGNNTYSMMPPDEAARYAPEVTNRWECKAVGNPDVTYRFLLCRTTILPRNPAIRRQAEEAARGTSAYVLLTDGREARATFSLNFETDAAPARPDAAAMARIADLARENFHLRFVSPSWESRIAASAILAAGRFVTAGSTTGIGGDHCEWRPQSPATAILLDENDTTVRYYLTRTDRSPSTPAALTFEALTAANIRLGTLRCVFPGSGSASDIEMSRLLATFGEHIRIELHH